MAIMPGSLYNLWSQSYYFTACLVVSFSLKDEIKDVSLTCLYLHLLLLPLLWIIRRIVLEAISLKWDLQE